MVSGERWRLGRPRTLQRLLVALIALAVLATVLGVAVPRWRQARAVAAFAETCRTIARESAVRNRVVAHGGRMHVTVLGDSYAQGYLLQHPAQSWPSRLARPLRARVAVRSLGGTGFVASPCGPDTAYPDRVPSVLSSRPDLVVVEGGLNDVLAEPAVITAGLRHTVSELAGVRVVVVGPAAAPKWRPEARHVDRVLAAAAASLGVEYVSTYRWPLAFAADGIHLTAGSHRVFGDRVAAAVAP